MRENRMLRARRRELETEPRTTLAGHEGGNPGDRQGKSYGRPRQLSTLPVFADYECPDRTPQWITTTIANPR